MIEIMSLLLIIICVIIPLYHYMCMNHFHNIRIICGWLSELIFIWIFQKY